MSNLDVSVVICTYNRAAMLGEALASLCALRMRPGTTYEILVVDNASTDETPQVVAALAAEAPVPLRRPDLAGLRELENKYSAPAFNVKEAATSCAIFSYLVHIIRDFQKDQLNNLNYFADDLLEKHGLNRNDLSGIARGDQISNGFRELIAEYYQLAVEYRQKTYDCIRAIWPYLGPRYQLSLEIIFELYLMVFERIDILHGRFTTGELNPTPEESKKCVYRVIMNSRTIKV